MWEGQAPAGSLCKNRTRQGVLPRKGKGCEGPQDGGPLAAATAHSWGPAGSTQGMDSRAAETPEFHAAAGPEAGTALPLGLHAPEAEGHTGRLQAPAGPDICPIRVLSHRRVARDRLAPYRVHNKSRCGTTRDSKGAFPPRESEAPGRHRQHGPRAAGPSGRPHHCPRPCPRTRSDSWGQAERAAHDLPAGTYVGAPTFALYRETLSSWVRPTPASWLLLSQTRTTVVQVGWAGGAHRRDQ